MVLNIGGIANLSLLIPGQPVGGYDTGPGNMLMDAWIWRQAGKPYDKDAEWARAGKVILPLLQNMLATHISRNLHRKAPDANTLTTAGWHIRHFPGVDPRDVRWQNSPAMTISEQVCQRWLRTIDGMVEVVVIRYSWRVWRHYCQAQKSPPPMPLALVAMTWKHWLSPGLPGGRWRDYQEICLPSLAQARRYWGLFSLLTRDIRVN